MKLIYRPIVVCLLLLTATLSSGCLPHNPAVRAAVVIFNDTDTALTYQLLLSSNWSPVTDIKPGELDYVLEYDLTDKSEGIARQLTKIWLKAGTCTITLNRQDIIRHMAKDPEGRNTWDLHVTPKLLSLFGC